MVKQWFLTLYSGPFQEQRLPWGSNAAKWSVMQNSKTSKTTELDRVSSYLGIMTFQKKPGGHYWDAGGAGRAADVRHRGGAGGGGVPGVMVVGWWG